MFCSYLGGDVQCIPSRPERDGTNPCSCSAKKATLPHAAHPHITLDFTSPRSNMPPPDRKLSTPIFRYPKKPPFRPPQEATFRYPDETKNQRLEREARSRWGFPPRKSLADLRPSRLPRFLALELSHPAGRSVILTSIITTAVVQYTFSVIEGEGGKKNEGRAERGTGI